MKNICDWKNCKELGNFKEATTSYRQAVKIQPDYSKAHFNLGNILNDFGKFKEAIPNLLLALKIKPNFKFCNYK